MSKHALQDNSSGGRQARIHVYKPKTAAVDMNGETVIILGKVSILSVANVCAVNNLAMRISIGILTAASANAMTTKFVKVKRMATN